MLAAEDVETQRKGSVRVLYLIGQSYTPNFSNGIVWKGTHLFKALPIRNDALHICYDSVLWMPTASIIKVCASLYTRLRVRSHYGKKEH